MLHTLSSAIISSCGCYRYRLERNLGQPGPVVAIIGVNPSTADAVIDDHTIRKVIGFGRRLGLSRVIMGNLFAFRATDVNMLKMISDPVGPLNDIHLVQIMHDADIIIVAWGSLTKLPKSLQERWKDIVRIANNSGRVLYCWGATSDGHPRHPLMLSYETPLIVWKIP